MHVYKSSHRASRQRLALLKVPLYRVCVLNDSETIWGQTDFLKGRQKPMMDACMDKCNIIHMYKE